MKLAGGTKKALTLLDKLRESGNLIDVYNLSWIRDKKNVSFITPQMLNEFDKKYGDEYHHHLLAIFIDDSVSGQELIDVYPDFDEKFNDQVFKPTLIFINLFSQQVLAITRVRKGNVVSDFVPHPSGIKDSNSFDRRCFIDKQYQARKNAMHQLDYANVINRLTTAMEQIAFADYNLVYREIDSGHIQDLLAKGPNRKGFYELAIWDEDEDSSNTKLLSKRDLDFAINEIKELESTLQKGIDTIANFFPNRPVTFDDFVRDE